MPKREESKSDAKHVTLWSDLKPHIPEECSPHERTLRVLAGALYYNMAFGGGGIPHPGDSFLPAIERQLDFLLSVRFLVE